MNECDKCGLEDPECSCYLQELELKIEYLSDRLNLLTYVVDQISDYIKLEKDEGYVKPLYIEEK